MSDVYHMGDISGEGVSVGSGAIQVPKNLAQHGMIPPFEKHE